MDIKPVISVDSVTSTSPKMSSLTTTALPPCSSSKITTATTTSMSGVLATLCGACCGPICDQYIMRVVDTYYHERCLQCFSCSVRLMHSCFARNGKLYCRLDYERYDTFILYLSCQ